MKKILLLSLVVTLLCWSIAFSAVPTVSAKHGSPAKVEKKDATERPSPIARAAANKQEKLQKKQELQQREEVKKQGAQQKTAVKPQPVIDQSLIVTGKEAAPQTIQNQTQPQSEPKHAPEAVPFSNQPVKSATAQFITTPAGDVRAPGIGDNPIPTDIILSQDFEVGGLPDGWTDSPDDSIAWGYDGGILHGPGAAHGGSYAAYFNIYSFHRGATDSLITPSIDFSASSGSYLLSYWSWHNSGNDSLVVFLSEAGVRTRLQKMPNTSAWTQNIISFNSTSNDGKIYFVGYSDWGLYNLYIDDVELQDAPSVGRCCYGSPVSPTCEDLSSTDCATHEGAAWNPTISCDAEPCPAVAEGDQCIAPFIIDALPYTDTRNTADFNNDYGHSGRDVVYELTLTERTRLDISTCNSVDPAFDNYLYVWGPGQCGTTNYLAYADGGCTDQLAHISNLVVPAGTYYILVEAYFSTSDGEYTLEVTGEYVPPVLGEDCNNPIDLTVNPGSMPVVDNNTTCGMFNDYTNTCLNYYDGGEDIIYRVTVTQAGCFNIALDPGTSTWTGIALDAACPLDPSTCIAVSTNSSASVHGIYGISLDAGVYYLMIDTDPTPTCIDNFTLTIDNCAPPPSNDVCANAIAIPNTYPTEVTGTTNGALANDCPDSLPGANAIWYTINLPYAVNNLTIDFCPTTERAVTGYGRVITPNCSCTNFTRLDYTTTSCGSFYQPKLTGRIAGPGTVYFPLYISGAPINFDFTVDVTEYIPPTPDFTVTAPGNWADPSQNTCGANDDCDLRTGEDQLWQITIPTAGRWIFSLCGTSTMWDSYLYLGTTVCSGDLGYDDDGCGTTWGLGKISAIIPAGTYYLDVEGFAADDCGAYILDVQPGLPPAANDNCSAAQAIGDVTDQPFTTIGATHDGPGTYIMGPNIWYIYTPTLTGVATIKTCGSSFSAAVAVYDGATCDPLPVTLGTNSYGCTGSGGLVRVSVTAGNQYLIEVGGLYSGTVGDGVLTTFTELPPANDNCSNATLIGDVTDQPWSTAAATFDGFGTYITSPNIWFLYTASCSGTGIISLCGSSFDTRLAVYDGATCDPLGTMIGSDDDACDPGLQSIVYIPVVEGNQYLIEVGGFLSYVGDGVISTSCVPPPNPDFVVTAPGSWSDPSQNTCGSGNECFTDPSEEQVWEVTIPTDGRWVFDMCGSPQWDAYMYLGTTICGSDLGEIDGGCGGSFYLPKLNAMLSAGTYYVTINGYGTDDCGEYVFNVSQGMVATNDNCSDAIPVGEVTNLPFTTFGASFDGGGTYMTGPNVWYLYTPTITGPMEFSLCGSEYDTRIAVYNGATCDPLADTLGVDDDGCDAPTTMASKLTREVVVGSQYLVEVGGYLQNVGDGVLTIAPPPPPPTNECDSPQLLYTNGDPSGYSWASQCFAGNWAAGTADDFVLPGSGNITVGRIVAYEGFWNSYGTPGTPADLSGIVVTIYADNGGMPAGNPIDADPNCAHDNVVMSEVVAPDQFTYVEFLPGIWQIVLPIAPTVLTANTTYWLEVAPILDFTGFGQCGPIPTLALTGASSLMYFPSIGYTAWQIPLDSYGDPMISDMAFCLLGPGAPPSGTIHGTAFQQDGVTPLPQVHVTTYDAGNNVVDNQVANALGVWNASLPAGTYHEHVTKIGFSAADINNIVVTTGGTTNVSVNMAIQTGVCSYAVGDANGSGTWTGQDVTYGVRFFKGGNPPPYSCECPAGSGHTWYVAGDVNGSCTFTGQDVTFMVRHFKSGTPAITCPDCPPAVGLLKSTGPAAGSSVEKIGSGQ